MKNMPGRISGVSRFHDPEVEGGYSCYFWKEPDSGVTSFLGDKVIVDCRTTPEGAQGHQISRSLGGGLQDITL